MDQNKIGRREFVTAAMGLLAAGCSSSGGLLSRAHPDIVPMPSPRDYRDYTRRHQQSNIRPRPYVRRSPATLTVVPRHFWTTTSPIARRVKPMSSVARMTVHHEGSSAFGHEDVAGTIQRISKIRKTHVQSRGWGDIGYHYIIDRAGRVWEGRPARFQGAHVKNNNAMNLGVMCLGNFEIQSPTAAQLAALERTVAHMVRWYRIPVGNVFTHRELAATQCPGRLLQPRMVAMRASGVFA